jgi:hypothetical protein
MEDIEIIREFVIESNQNLERRLPPSQLKTGHYVTGRTAWGAIVDVYCIGPGIVWNVATGERVTITGSKAR